MLIFLQSTSISETIICNRFENLENMRLINILECGNRLRIYHNKSFIQREKIVDYELNLKIRSH